MARLIVAGTASRKKRRSIIATRKSVTRERKNSLCVRLAASESRSRVYSASAFLRYLPVSRTVKPRFSHLLFVVFRPKEKRHRVFALLQARFTSPPYILLLYSPSPFHFRESIDHFAYLIPSGKRRSRYALRFSFDSRVVIDATRPGATGEFDSVTRNY